MSENTKYWLTAARFGVILAIGGSMTVYAFRSDNAGFGWIVGTATVVVALVVYLAVDRRNVRQRQG